MEVSMNLLEKIVLGIPFALMPILFFMGGL